MLGRQHTVCVWAVALWVGAIQALPAGAWSDSDLADCSKFFSPETTPYEGRLSRQGVLCVRGEKVQPDSVMDKRQDREGSEITEINRLPSPATGARVCQPKADGETCVSPEPEQPVQGPPN